MTNPQAIEPSFNLWGVVLAGGAGSRMGDTGKQIPKIYLPIGLEPVLNRPVEACLQRIGSQGRVIVLTRKRHDALDLDLENWATGWKRVWFGDERRVEVWFEEDAANTQTQNLPGACVALAAFLTIIETKKVPQNSRPSHLLIIAGDNYFDGNLEELVENTKRYPKDAFLATKAIDDPEQAVDRFGVVKIDENAIPPQRILRYTEKPARIQDSGTTIALGIYCLPVGHVEQVSKYVSDCMTKRQEELDRAKDESDQKMRDAAQGRADRYETRVGPPGYFIEHFTATLPFRAVPLSCVWFDVGTETSYLSTMIQHTGRLLRQPRAARELVAMGDAASLTDKSYFLCRRINLDAASRTITLDILGTDPVAALSAELAGDQVRSLDQVISDNRIKNDYFWDMLRKAHNGTWEKRDRWTPELPSPILIAGGVVLLDQRDPGSWSESEARVPLLLRDIGATVDALRLTTPAGRMDQLDLAAVCIAELAEEVVFFGGDSGHQVQIVAPSGYRGKAVATVLERLESGKVIVPGLDLAELKANRKHRVPTQYRIVPTAILPPPTRVRSWKVQVRYKARETDGKWSTPMPPRDFALILDKEGAVLEFRMFVAANLIDAVDKVSVFDRDYLTLGKLRGAIDGDGFGRPVLFVSYTDLENYARNLANDKAADILTRSDPHPESLRVIAMTDGRTGRFRRIDDEYRLSVAALTTTMSQVL